MQEVLPGECAHEAVTPACGHLFPVSIPGAILIPLDLILRIIVLGLDITAIGSRPAPKDL